jgi:hypothetical protein
MGSTSAVNVALCEPGQRFADGKQPHRDDDDVHAVEEVGDAEREARLAAERVDADEAEGETDEQAQQAARE